MQDKIAAEQNASLVGLTDKVAKNTLGGKMMSTRLIWVMYFLGQDRSCNRSLQLRGYAKCPNHHYRTQGKIIPVCSKNANHKADAANQVCMEATRLVFSIGANLT
jgi:hypothetical protein